MTMSAELALLSERIERFAWRDLFANAQQCLPQRVRFAADEIDDVLALATPDIDSLLFNRAIGLGSDRSCDDATLSRVLATYATAGVHRFWVHVTESARERGLCELLTARGLAPYPRAWTKFIRDTRPLEVAPSTLTVRAARTADAFAVASIAGPAFDLPQTGAETFAWLVERPRWHLFVAEDAGTVVAAGGLFVDGELAYHAFAATRPSERNRGAQSLLMQARIERAHELGCRFIATETGTPLAPDEPNPSYSNMLRCGFVPVCERANYAPPGTTWLAS
jgi:GNAT superfamily N-acetyltransferase